MHASKPRWRRAFDHRVQISISVVDLAAVALVALLAVPVVEHLGANGYALTGDRHFADIRSYLHNPLAYFMQRSPGARGSQGLIQTKHPVSRVLSQVRKRPQERVLANVRYNPPIPYVNDLVPNAAPSFLAANLPTPADIGGGGGGVGGPPLANPPVVPFVFGGPGTGTNNNGSAVPETSTWLTLIWGMALIGLRLRSRQRPLMRGAAFFGFNPKR